MDLRITEIRAAEAVQNAGAEALSRRAAKLAKLKQRETAPESDMAHALRTRRKLRTPLSTKL